MPAMTIRNMTPETHRAIKARAAAHQRSAEAEVRAILDAAVGDPQRARVGSVLTAIGRSVGGVELDTAPRETAPRETAPREPIDLT